jgi:uncharacterized membrane protein YkgB
MEERISSKNTLASYEKPNLYQKFPEETAEYDYLIKRNLRKQASTNPKAAEIYQNSKYLKYDDKKGIFYMIIYCLVLIIIIQKKKFYYTCS